MITNERQYRITRTEIRKLEAALAQGADPESQLDSRMQATLEASLRAQLEDLRTQLWAYEALRAGPGVTITLQTLDDLPAALTQARIAAGLTQRQLAARLDLKEQQIQRYEQSAYMSASWARLLEVASALGVRLVGTVQITVDAHWLRMADEAAAQEHALASSYKEV